MLKEMEGGSNASSASASAASGSSSSSSASAAPPARPARPAGSAGVGSGVGEDEPTLGDYLKFGRLMGEKVGRLREVAVRAWMGQGRQRQPLQVLWCHRPPTPERTHSLPVGPLRPWCCSRRR